MKKYISFIILAGLIFSFSIAHTAKAEIKLEAGASVEVSTEDKPLDRPLGKPEVKNIKAKITERQEYRDEHREEQRKEWLEFKAKIQTERKVFVDNLKERKDAFLAEVKARKEEWKNANTERKAKFCDAARNMVTVKFETAIKILEVLQSKTVELSAELKAEGKDTASIDASVNLSKQKLADAKAKLAETKKLVPEGGCADMTPEVFEKIKIGAREAKDLLKESREALHTAVKEIRILQGEIGIEAQANIEARTEVSQ